MIRVLVADDHAVLRAGAKEIVSQGFQDAICGEAANGEQVLDQVKKQKWDLVILDIAMPGRSGVEVLCELKRLQPKLPVLVLSMHPEDQYGRRMLRAGASGFMSKDVAPDELINAIRKVLTGGRYVSPTLAEKLAMDLNTRDTGLPPHEVLSEREFEVLRMIAAGKTVVDIAEEIHLSVATVSTYRARILLKLNMNTTADLIRYAIENHLVV
jgi:DNA-binding NarL/FixJ family response regulator